MFLGAAVIVKTSSLSLSQRSSMQKSITRTLGTGAEDGIAMVVVGVGRGRTGGAERRVWERNARK